MKLTELERKILSEALYQWANDDGYNDPIEPVFETNEDYLTLVQKLSKEDERDQDGDVINWKEVASSFFGQCGGVGGCGDLDGVDNLCKYYAKNLSSKECHECGTEKDLKWLEDGQNIWVCAGCKDLFVEEDNQQ